MVVSRTSFRQSASESVRWLMWKRAGTLLSGAKQATTLIHLDFRRFITTSPYLSRQRFKE